LHVLPAGYFATLLFPSMIEMPFPNIPRQENTPYLHFRGNGNAEFMRKSGNGHNIDLEQFLNNIKTIVQDGEDLLKAGVTEVKQRAVTGAKTTDRAVREHPYKTLGIVFGLGVLVGVLAVGLTYGENDDEEQVD
jgi:ElaB/YqjD/DUF883 family membrane-anchored ribosome-binding protein